MNKITNKKETRDLFQMELTQLEKDNSFLLEKLKMARLDGDFKENADWLLIEEKISANRQKIVSLKNKIAELEQNNNVSKFITYRLLATGEEKLIELTDY